MPLHRLLTALLLPLLLAACAPLRPPERPAAFEPRLNDDHALMDDGYRLPLDAWRAADEPRAVVVALHGFNDYRRAFASAGPFLAERGITVYAYDQRGFGETAYRGLWAGSERLTADLRAMLALLRRRHPELPLYLLGESMGGAVTIAALAADPDLPVDGVVLVAPAVWSRLTMPWYQRWGLWLAGRLAPGWKPTGESLNRWPTDNIELLRAMARDPMVIKATRIDTSSAWWISWIWPWRPARDWRCAACCCTAPRTRSSRPSPPASCCGNCPTAATPAGAPPSIRTATTCCCATSRASGSWRTSPAGS